MTLPAATLDHVVINARDDMDRAADIYRRLGFTLTERVRENFRASAMVTPAVTALLTASSTELLWYSGKQL